MSFLPALLDPSAPVPPGLTDPAGNPAGRRFDVYRNNVTHSLTEAMSTGFPVIEKLVGRDFFRAMAVEFIRAHPPRSPLLFAYGDAFPAFLEAFPPVAHLPYLADTARLELALRTAYHAADATPAPQALTAEDLMARRVALAPAVQLVASPYPVLSIWRANTEPGASPARGGAEVALVARPGFDPVAQAITPPQARFITALLAGETFGQAIDRAGDFDLTATLTLLVALDAITGTEPA